MLTCGPSRLPQRCCYDHLGVWRPHTVIQIYYRDAELGWMRDPENPNGVIPVAYSLIHQVKLGDGIKTDQSDMWVSDFAGRQDYPLNEVQDEVLYTPRAVSSRMYPPASCQPSTGCGSLSKQLYRRQGYIGAQASHG